MLKKKKTTASGKLVLVKSVRRTRSHRMKFCVQRGLGALPSTSKRRGKSRRDFALCGSVCINTGIACRFPGFSYPVFMPFRAVFLQTRKEDAYTSSFSSSATFNLMAPSMTPSTMGRYFSGQSCNLWLVRWRCSLSSRSSSGLK